MPLIKDKDRYKKLSSRDRGRARLSESSNLPNKSINISKRNNQESTEKKKTEDILEASNLDSNLTSVNSIYVDSGTIKKIFTLLKGQTLKKFLISNATSSNSVLDLHWSFKPENDLILTLQTSGHIVESNNESTRLFRTNMNGFGSYSGATDLVPSHKTNAEFDIEDLFNNVSKDIYFYFTAEQDMYITYLIT